MNAAEANQLKNLLPDFRENNSAIFHARGYLEALEGPEVKILREALEEIRKNGCMNPESSLVCGSCIAKSVLAEFDKAVKS